ncbi:MAG: diguanylate cyclase [Cycloclasticus sp.]
MNSKQQESKQSVTGLADAATFEEQTKHLLEFSKRTNAKAVMLFITFDLLISDINTQQSDLALKAIADRLLSKARDSDVYAHLYDMNFANLTIETSEDHVSILVEKLKNELAEPIVLEGGSSIKLNAAIGIAEFPQQGDSYKELLDIAKKDALK